MKKCFNRKGISLMSLVITIIILIILASAIILSLNMSGIIDNTNKAAMQNDIKEMQAELDSYVANKILKSRNRYKKEQLYADKDRLVEMGKVVEGKTIKEVLPTTWANYTDEIEIVNGKVVYVGQDFNKLKWANELLLNVRGRDVAQTETKDDILAFKNSASLNLLNYKIYGESIENKLPAEYQQVEYIESTGTQYINTGYYPNYSTRVIADYQYTKNTNAFLFGSRTLSNSTAYTINISNGNLVSAFNNTGNVKYATFDLNRHVVEKRGNEVYMDGVLKLTQPETMFYVNREFEIFAAHSASNEGYLPSNAKLYSFKIYDRDVLIRDFIPCYKTEDGVETIGLYDKVNNKFYTNQGTGNFEKGPDVTSYNDIKGVGDLVEEGEYKGKYKIPVKVTGKNIYDIETYYTKYINNNGGITYTNKDFHDIHWYLGTKVMKGRFKENTRYVVSFDYELTNSDQNTISLHVFYTDGTKSVFNTGTVTGEKAGHSKIITTDNKTVSYIDLTFSSANRTCNVKFSNMMIEEGIAETEYEPYQEHNYYIYLDEPLRKVGDYVDYIDFRTQKVVRNVKVTENNGTIILEGLDKPQEERVDIPNMLLRQGSSSMHVTTTLSPSKIESIYYTK